MPSPATMLAAMQRLRLPQLVQHGQALATTMSGLPLFGQALVAQQGAAGGLQCGPSGRGYAVGGITQTSPSRLDQVMKVDQLVGKSSEEIAKIWLDYHLHPDNKGRAGAVISADEWALLQERAKKSPLFVLPLAKPGGYLTLLTQQQLPFTLITSLEEYQRYGPNAPASMTVTHYPELVDSAKLVLVRADIVNDKIITAAEARTLLELLRAVYSNGEDYKMVLDFNHQPTAFDFNKLLTKMAIKPPTDQ